jgi:hypothetical protein
MTWPFEFGKSPFFRDTLLYSLVIRLLLYQNFRKNIFGEFSNFNLKLLFIYVKFILKKNQENFGIYLRIPKESLKNPFLSKIQISAFLLIFKDSKNLFFYLSEIHILKFEIQPSTQSRKRSLRSRIYFDQMTLHPKKYRPG